MSSTVWQPDADAKFCVLCSNPYTFLNRRHHCRKCGRVVCGDCALHLIRYFAGTMVVTPDKLVSPLPFQTYRTCDECYDELRMVSAALESPSVGSLSGGAFSPLPTTTALQMSSVARSRPGMLNNNDSTTSISKHIANTHTRMVQSSTQSSAVATPRVGPSDASDHNLCPVCATNLYVLFRKAGQTGLTGTEPPAAQAQAHGRLFVPDFASTQPMTSISALAMDSSASLSEDFETFKEAHICDCLTQFDFTLDHQRSPTADGSRLHTRNKMLVYNIPPIPKPQFETLALDSSQTEDVCSEYSSSEKHVASECVICFEDLSPGDKVGRLECLCVFHYRCIKDWFNRKGYGECPVHFLHQ